jgi:leucyl/phenylalanyl-tRNA--protein transferase
LLDAQFLTRHLSQFGAEDIDRGEFHRRLAHALEIEADFGPPEVQRTGAEALQLITQTS